MKCPKCHHENPEDAKFCQECGNRLFAASETVKTSSIPEAERKRVTALFSDLTGYTAMTERLDPEEVKEITGRIFNGVKAVVSKYEGFIEKFAGDGILALFGVPRAHEDDPVRAIQAAREIHGLVETLSPRYETKIGRPLSMHSGINTGLVVTADVDEEKGTHGVTGKAINVAARLSNLAEARDILVGPNTYRASQTHFAFQPLKPAKVKGKSERIPVYKVLSEKAATACGHEMQVSSEMVGRDQELAKLELHVLKAVNGQGSVVNVFGEPGVGKSRLLAELRQRDVISRVSFLEGRSISIGKNLSFYPVIDLYKQWARIKEDDTQTEASNKLETSIRRVCEDEADEVFPFVATMMGMKLSGKHSQRIEGIEGEALEKLILKNVRELLIRSTELIPIVIVMEDLHWADTTSLELLESLFRLAQTYRVVFINVFRPGYWQGDDRKVETLPEWLPEIDFVEIAIKPLDRKTGEALVNNILQVKGLPYAIKQQIVDRSGGNPFFMEEIVRSLIDEGAIVQTNGTFQVTEKIDHVVIPSTINDVLMARIDRLEEQTRYLIKVASVIGRSFFDRILKEVANSIEGVDERLSYLKDAQFIRDRMRMEELEYLFKHALAQEAVYGSTLIQQRKELHLRVAQSIEKVFREQVHEFYGMLAHHYSMGEDEEKAEEYLIKAGAEALKSSASSEALYYFKDAIKLYTKRYGDAVDPNKMAEFEENVAFAFFNRGHHAEAIDYFDKTLNRLGFKEPKNKIFIFIELIINLLNIVKDLYLPSIRRKKAPTLLEKKILNIILARGQSLTSVDAKRFFIGTIMGIKRCLKFDPSTSQLVFNFISGASAVFSYTGFSFTISKRILDYARKSLPATDDKISPYFHKMCETVHNFLTGNWHEEFGENLIDYDIKIGEIMCASHHLAFSGFIYTELGDFDHAKNIIKKLRRIGNEFSDDGAKTMFYYLNGLLLKKQRKLEDALKAINECIILSENIGQRDRNISLLGKKSQIQVMQDDLGNAEASLDRSETLSNEGIASPYYYSSYLMGVLLYNLAQLEKSLISKNNKAILKYKNKSLKSGIKAIRNSKKVVSERTKAYRQMGRYYWLIGKQGKALKWWDKSIQEGEGLGARPNLSRTYLEIGKRLLDHQSKHKKLNGIDGKGYLEKAKALFEEMDLQRDLDELDKITLDS